MSRFNAKSVKKKAVHVTPERVPMPLVVIMNQIRLKKISKDFGVGHEKRTIQFNGPLKFNPAL